MTTGRAAFIRELGDPSVIEVGELPVPPLGPLDVLVSAEAMAANHVDTFVRSGGYATPTPFPFVVGRDLVGTVAAVGGGVTGFVPGDRVWTNSLGHGGRQGSFATLVAVPAERLYPLPPSVAAYDAVRVLHVAATAWLGLFRRASLALGETVLVNGAGGGVGSCVVQLAKAAGARVVATTSAADLAWVRSCGADEVLDHGSPDLAAALDDVVGPGVDVWWDNSGINDVASALPRLSLGGRVLMISGLSSRPSFAAGDLYTRDASVLGFAISNASVSDLASAARAINALLARGALSVQPGEVFPLSRAADAHRALEAGARGRLLVVPD
ncbi:MAG TPA: NADPH:quinone reductase [Marmoricola sp.]|nr:NADPH:quinone reductase [Marmoricola sp.]